MPMLSNVQLRTSIRIQRKVSGRKPGEITGNIEWIDIGNASSSDPPRYIRCQWVGAHGDETFSDEALQVMMLGSPILAGCFWPMSRGIS